MFDAQHHAEIEVRSLRKHYGPVEAVRGISFSVHRGEVLGFLGPNGAGKSTTMKMITGFVPASRGEIRVCGYDIQAQPIDAKRCIGYLPEGAPLYAEMTVSQLLGFVASIRDLAGAERRRRLDEVIGVLELEPVMQQRIEALSKGFKRRVGLALAVLHNPPVLILDEPTDGLDPNQKHHVRSFIRSLGSEKAIIISTHLLEEVDAVCDRTLIMDGGEIRFEGTPAELHALSPQHNAVLVSVAAGDAERAVEALRLVEGVAAVDLRPGEAVTELVVRPQGSASIADRVGAALWRSGIAMTAMSVDAGKLDEVFRLVTRAGLERAD